MKVKTVRKGYAVRTEDGAFLTHEYYGDGDERTYESGTLENATLFYTKGQAKAAVEQWGEPAQILPMRITVIKETGNVSHTLPALRVSSN